MVEEAGVKNATSAARSAILLATAPRVADTVAAVTEVEVTVEAIAVVVAGRPVTLVEVTATCLATARRAKSATIVCFAVFPFSQSVDHGADRDAGGEVGHLSRDCPSEPSSERVCYKCKQPGHVQAACPN